MLFDVGVRGESVAEAEGGRERETVAEAESALASGFQTPDADRCMYVCVCIYIARESAYVCVGERE